MRMPPWHSIDELVHHDHGECRHGAAVHSEKVRQGTGRKPRCSECARLARKKSFKYAKTDP